LPVSDKGIVEILVWTRESAVLVEVSTLQVRVLLYVYES